MDTPETAAPDPARLGASMAQNMPPVTGAAAPAAAPAPAASAGNGAPAAAAPASSEVDAKGRPFDASKFLPRKTKAGLWIPKSPGRFGRNGEKRPATPPASQGRAEADLFPDTSASSPSSASSSASAPSSSSAAGGGGGSYIPPETELPPPPSSTQSIPGAGKGDTLPPEPEAGADDVAEVACDLLAEGVGLITGAPEEAEPSAKEGARLRNVLGAYLRSKGIQTRGKWAVGLAFFAWLLRTVRKPKTRAWVRGQFNGKGTPARSDVIDIEPAPAPAATPAPAPPPAPPSERGPAAYSVTLPRR